MNCLRLSVGSGLGLSRESWKLRGGGVVCYGECVEGCWKVGWFESGASIAMHQLSFSFSGPEQIKT